MPGVPASVHIPRCGLMSILLSLFVRLLLFGLRTHPLLAVISIFFPVPLRPPADTMHGSSSSCHPVVLVQMMVVIVLVTIPVVALRPALWTFLDCIMSARMSLLRFVTSGTFLTSSVEIVIATLVSLGSEICLIVHPLVIALIFLERLIRPVRMEHRQSSLVSTLPGAVLRILRFLRFLAPASAREL